MSARAKRLARMSQSAGGGSFLTFAFMTAFKRASNMVRFAINSLATFSFSSCLVLNSWSRTPNLFFCRSASILSSSAATLSAVAFENFAVHASISASLAGLACIIACFSFSSLFLSSEPDGALSISSCFAFTSGSLAPFC